ncbi:fumarylacetoacetase [Sulfitobacter sp. S190]|uniref:fumarylacetoacetase n=1 Tax=Sulfitobacter sp. S190 TaxID=2867022 RepID=UPI0021A93736|nr:fumarylacetoacetase [Sulfitobacter sp. S190]UWR23034.1 fumarylacetoacetase [Sulfitobacter sp. S190]
MTLRKSWVESANDVACPFPLNNLPYGVFSTNRLEPRCGVAIGDMILDLCAAEEAGQLQLAEAPVFDVPYWNDVMELGPEGWQILRDRIEALLAEGSTDQAAVAPLLVPMQDARMHMPFVVAEFTDFYAGRHHAENVGTMFRGADNALPANWLHIPIGYNGRASTVVVSGTDILRPNGQTRAPDAEKPSFGPCARLDFELELGAIVGSASQMGAPVSVAQADEMIFGYVLLNDWSARDIQAWEYQPLGPFQAKAFATSISPWIVTRAALEPFRTQGPDRDTPLLPYLEHSAPMFYDIDLSVTLQTEDGPTCTLTRTNSKALYYAAAQQIAHHASSGCAMTPGDLIGSGTISGAQVHERGSMLELSWGGETPVDIGDGQTRSFLLDGDTVTLHGTAKGKDYQIGFGTCTGTIRPAPIFP